MVFKVKKTFKISWQINNNWIHIFTPSLDLVWNTLLSKWDTWGGQCDQKKAVLSSGTVCTDQWISSEQICTVNFTGLDQTIVQLPISIDIEIDLMIKEFEENIFVDDR